LNPPLPFARKRFAAPRFVFSFGMTFSSMFSPFQCCLDWAGGLRPTRGCAPVTGTCSDIR
jgi:hypothetical protein